MSKKKPIYQIQYRALDEITPLDSNPRNIDEAELRKLCSSIKENPEYFAARPLILSDRTGSLVVIAGNQRYKAASKIKLQEVPTLLMSGLTEAKEREIIIRDNVSNGTWDINMLAGEEWDDLELQEWGAPVPELANDRAGADHLKELTKWVPDCLFPSNNIYDVPTLLLDNQADVVHAPFKPYGAQKRSATGVGTYHFYVDDYRFEKIWENPNTIIQSECLAVVEPNLSLYNETPRSFGLHLIYKKRWMARYLQSFGLRIFVDLNVSSKFEEDNLLGVPDGWSAFATRGYADRLDDLDRELAVARRVSGKDDPLFVVYGGGKGAREFCAEHNLIYLEQVSQGK